MSKGLRNNCSTGFRFAKCVDISVAIGCNGRLFVSFDNTNEVRGKGCKVLGVMRKVPVPLFKS